MKKIIVIVCSMMLSVVGRADDGWGFTYQAHLLDAAGNVIVDAKGFPVAEHTVAFRIYASAWATDALWARQYVVICDTNGLFNVFLSDNATKLPDDKGQTLQDVLRSCTQGKAYVGLTVAGGTEIRPRQRLCAVPYAAVATAARSLAVVDGTAKMAGDVLVQGNLTAKEVAGSKDDKLTARGVLSVRSVKTEAGVDFFPVPIGGIILWTSNGAPNGGGWKDSVSTDGHWAICDGKKHGTVQTPDLQGRMPLGVSASHSLGTSGGATTVTINESMMPAHDHMFIADKSYKDLFDDLGKYMGETTQFGFCGNAIRNKNNKYFGYGVSYKDATGWSEDWNGGNQRTRSVPTASVGSGQSHNNMPPYYAVYFIMRIK